MGVMGAVRAMGVVRAMRPGRPRCPSCTARVRRAIQRVPAIRAWAIASVVGMLLGHAGTARAQRPRAGGNAPGSGGSGAQASPVSTKVQYSDHAMGTNVTVWLWTADEAGAFAQRYPGAFVISGDVPGRGMAYRVRYGNFPTFKDATSAKDSFEKQHGTIALVAAR